jgi:hypothetical protein
MPTAASITLVKPCESMYWPACSMAVTSSAFEGFGNAATTRRMADSANRPVSLLSRLSISPPSGFGVLCPIPAARIACVLTTAIWPQVRLM